MAASQDRITVSLSKDARANLDWLKWSTGLSATEIVDRALRAFALIKTTETGGGELLRRMPDREELEIIRFF